MTAFPESSICEPAGAISSAKEERDETKGRDVKRVGGTSSARAEYWPRLRDIENPLKNYISL